MLEWHTRECNNYLSYLKFWSHTLSKPKLIKFQHVLFNPRLKSRTSYNCLKLRGQTKAASEDWPGGKRWRYFFEICANVFKIRYWWNKMGREVYTSDIAKPTVLFYSLNLFDGFYHCSKLSNKAAWKFELILGNANL